MRVALTVHDLGLGGSQTYVLTVAEQLQRLGHEPVLYAAEGGPLEATARERCVPVAIDGAALPWDPDVMLVQDGVTSHRMAERHPGVPQLFRCASNLFDLQTPPQLEGPVAAVLVLSDRMRRRVEALALRREVIRLRQPVDIERFAAREAIRERPRRAVLLGGYLHADRRRMLVDAWQAGGVECVQVAGSRSPEVALADADIVVAKGKAALEGMACGRAVYVYDGFGADGWVTPDSYPALEADNFAGLAFETVPTPSRLAADLDGYSPHMGQHNRDLALRNHSAHGHAHELVGVLRRLAPRAAPPAPHAELARLTALGWQSQSRAVRQAVENSALQRRLLDVEEAWRVTERRALDAERRYNELTSTRRFRLAARLGRVADLLRRSR